MSSHLRLLAYCIAAIALCANNAHTKPKHTKPTVAAAATYEAESRLIDIYKLIGAGKSKEALVLASKLTQDFPNFQLAHLIHGDLLQLQARPIKTLGDVPSQFEKNAANQTALADLREESALRLKGLRERPPADTVPSQLLGLAGRNKHVIAVDTSKSRLYLLENTGQGLRLIADHYISVGQAGIGKLIEGDNKTPLGVYYLTSTVDPKGLPPLYGGGALPINYPNPFDLRLGKTGSGIWFHGTMPDRFARQPKSSNGCVVLANPDLRKLMATVAIKTTPVVIASQLIWVKPAQLVPERLQFEASLNAWRTTKNAGQTAQLQNFYMADFNNYGRALKDWFPTVVQDVQRANGKGFQWREVTTLMWRPESNAKTPNVMVVTYDEGVANGKQLQTKRQYWIQVGNQWKIFFEGTIAS